ncbi:MAG: ribosome-associated translation inhibitor RaiA [Candidatus Cloacimonetes bacterium]|nr:ribosome-associated translation inhibitor RaiA [Candidatus Cloacimonadota bacterium]
MKISITARHFDLTPAVKGYAEDSIQKLDLYSDQIISAEMVLTVEKNRNLAEINLKMKKFHFFSKSKEKSMYLAIDNAVRKIEKQTKRHFGKLQNHHKRENNSVENISNFNLEEENNISKNELILDVLNTERAIKKLKDSTENFLIFKNKDTEKINLLKIIGKSFELYEIK